MNLIMRPLQVFLNVFGQHGCCSLLDFIRGHSERGVTQPRTVWLLDGSEALRIASWRREVKPLGWHRRMAATRHHA
jgi:hypothetical protein